MPNTLIARWPRLAPRAAAVLLALVTGAACSALDGAPSDFPAARVQRTAANTSEGVAYADVSRTLKSGTVVHEFVDATGAVFALSWSGPFKPDLKRLLGRHFDRLHDGAGKRQANRSSVDIQASDFVVQSGGHMGAFEGRAWLPSRLPAGFDTQEMK
ncbi:DUF2844 domain-containing protein [Ramlibacter monticola]|uniref:DUF2844 domain-containing protein n=1 Tax=Ramlibacter monticola TaxID=1926872 RepID=UPI001F2145D5|nr:DUF2844 domain-containing protein [Ramlibacter monticola]